MSAAEAAKSTSRIGLCKKKGQGTHVFFLLSSFFFYFILASFSNILSLYAHENNKTSNMLLSLPDELLLHILNYYILQDKNHTALIPVARYVY